MRLDLSLLRPSRLPRMLFGFGFLHAYNAILAMAHTLVQLVIMARVLPGPTYTAVVAITALGLYLQPISQASARANYVALRAYMTGTRAKRAPPEVTLLLYASLGITLAVSSLFFVVVVSHEAGSTAALYLLIVAAIGNNIWYYDLQFSLWAVDYTTRFERLSFLRRIALMACLVPLYLTGDLLMFAILTIAVTVAFMMVLIGMIPDPGLLLPANLAHLTRAGTLAQARRFGTALLSTLSELTVFNAPYAVIVYAFGLGPALVSLDSTLKLTRAGLSLTRNISEIVLPQQSRARSQSDRGRSMRLFGLALGGALALNAVVALALALFGDVVFHQMLGPNNVLPSGAGLPASAIQVAATVYGASSFFLAFTSHDREVVWLTAVAVVGMAAFAIAVVALHPAVLAVLWAYALFLVIVAAVSAVLVVGHDLRQLTPRALVGATRREPR